ncbi:hypothetical protein CCS05_11970 (plasmid) [Levilactobacillus brevis]|nr:hypothetical protein CCS05_11970 [Levilactobacillus brevis]
MVNTILKEADLFCPNSVRINFTIYLTSLRLAVLALLHYYSSLISLIYRHWCDLGHLMLLNVIGEVIPLDLMTRRLVAINQ